MDSKADVLSLSECRELISLAGSVRTILSTLLSAEEFDSLSKQMTDALQEGRAVTLPEALEAVKNRLKEVNADVQVEQEEYDEIVQIKAMFLNHDYQ